MPIKKFQIIMEEDQGYILHNETPKCKAKLGDDEDLLDGIEWKEPVTEIQKEAILKEMEEWYDSDFKKI